MRREKYMKYLIFIVAMLCWGGTAVSQQLPHHELRQIAAGASHTCATSDRDQPWCWGYGSYGQIGIGSVHYQNYDPRSVLIHFRHAASVAAGHRISCGLDPEGTLWCWGGIYGAYCCNPRAGPGERVTTAIPMAIEGPVVSYATGNAHTCAVTDDGRVWCFGFAKVGQTGNAGYPFVHKKPTVIKDLPPARQVALGGSHSCALTREPSEVWCWGRNHDGELGVADTAVTKRWQAARVEGLPHDVVALSAGVGASTCAMTQSHGVWCWGANRYGQLGVGHSEPRQAVPQKVTAMEGIKTMVPGFNHSCAIAHDDTVWCWGRGDQGKLGNGSSEDSTVPVQVKLPGKAAQLTVGGAHACAIALPASLAVSLQRPRAYCWGNNRLGQLGLGAELHESAVPVAVPFPPVDGEPPPSPSQATQEMRR